MMSSTATHPPVSNVNGKECSGAEADGRRALVSPAVVLTGGLASDFTMGKVSFVFGIFQVLRQIWLAKCQLYDWGNSLSLAIRYRREKPVPCQEVPGKRLSYF